MKKKEDTVHVAFRSKETGRYLFHVVWSIEEFSKIEQAAALDKVSVEDFILMALKRYTDESRVPN